MSAIVKLYRAAVWIFIFAIPIAVYGHHSNSEYDRSVVTEFDGEVLSVSWRNPHILLKVASRFSLDRIERRVGRTPLLVVADGA